MNKKYLKIYTLLIVLIITLSSCNKKDEVVKEEVKVDNKEKSLIKAEKLIEDKNLIEAEKVYESLFEMFNEEKEVYRKLAYIKNYYGNTEEACEILIKGIVNLDGEKEELYLDLIDMIDEKMYKEKYKKYFLELNQNQMTDNIFNNLLVLNKYDKEEFEDIKNSFKPKNDELLVFLENKINNYEDEELEEKLIKDINEKTDVLLLEELIRDRVLTGYSYYEDMVLAEEIMEKIENNNIDINDSFLKGLKYYFDNYENEKIEKIYFEDLDFDMKKDLILITSNGKYLYEDGGNIDIIFSNGNIINEKIENSKANEMKLIFSDLNKDAFKEILSLEYYGGIMGVNNYYIYSTKDYELNELKILENENLDIEIANNFKIEVLDRNQDNYSSLTLDKEIINTLISKNIYNQSGKLLDKSIININTDTLIKFDKLEKQENLNINKDIYIKDLNNKYIATLTNEYILEEDGFIFKDFYLKDKDDNIIPKQSLSNKPNDDVEDIEIEEDFESNYTKEDIETFISNIKFLKNYFGKTSDEIISIFGKPDRELLEDLHLGYAKYLVYKDEDNQENYFTFNIDSDKLVGLDGKQEFILGVNKYPRYKDIITALGNSYIKDDEYFTGARDMEGNELDELVYILEDSYILTFTETLYNSNEYRLSLFLNTEN